MSLKLNIDDYSNPHSGFASRSESDGGCRRAVKACILCEFLTSKNLPIRVFRYSEDDKSIRIEAGFKDKQIKMIINENGRFKFV